MSYSQADEFRYFRVKERIKALNHLLNTKNISDDEWYSLLLQYQLDLGTTEEEIKEWLYELEIEEEVTRKTLLKDGWKDLEAEHFNRK